MCRVAAVIGAGGHARVIVSEIEMSGEYDSIEIYTIDTHAQNEVILGYPVVENADVINSSDSKRIDIFLAIGDLKIRSKWYSFFSDLNFHMPNLIARTALVSSSARLGSANFIASGSYLGPNVMMGNNNLINTKSIIEHESILGDSCNISPGAVLCGRVSLGSNVFIGANSTVIEKLCISSDVALGAGSTLIESINHRNVLWCGSPARKIKNAN